MGCAECDVHVCKAACPRVQEKGNTSEQRCTASGGGTIVLGNRVIALLLIFNQQSEDGGTVNSQTVIVCVLVHVISKAMYADACACSKVGKFELGWLCVYVCLCLCVCADGSGLFVRLCVCVCVFVCVCACVHVNHAKWGTRNNDRK